MRSLLLIVLLNFISCQAMMRRNHVSSNWCETDEPAPVFCEKFPEENPFFFDYVENKVKTLIKEKKDLDQNYWFNGYTDTPLRVVRRFNRFSALMELLLKQGANPNL